MSLMDLYIDFYWWVLWLYFIKWKYVFWKHFPRLQHSRSNEEQSLSFKKMYNALLSTESFTLCNRAFVFKYFHLCVICICCPVQILISWHLKKVIPFIFIDSSMLFPQLLNMIVCFFQDSMIIYSWQTLFLNFFQFFDNDIHHLFYIFPRVKESGTVSCTNMIHLSSVDS